MPGLVSKCPCSLLGNTSLWRDFATVRVAKVQPLSPCRQPGEAEPSQGGVAVLPARAADGRHGHLPTPQYIVDQQKLTRRWKEEQ